MMPGGSTEVTTLVLLLAAMFLDPVSSFRGGSWCPRPKLGKSMMPWPSRSQLSFHRLFFTADENDESPRSSPSLDIEKMARSTSLDQDYLYLERFRRRKLSLERRTAMENYSRPPNPFLGPCEFVNSLLEALMNRQDCALLLRASTPDWNRVLQSSIGYIAGEYEEAEVSRRLQEVLSQDSNQFALLMGSCGPVRVVFPTEPLDYGDGACWVECRLRSKQDDTLLAVIGWSLKHRSTDSAWLLDGLDWQDFRDRFRPGRGREEWERICG